MKATAQMGGLTREEIADLRECNIDGQPVVYLNTPARMRQLCDLALQSLESVRSEALQKLKFDLEDIETESHSPVYAARLSSWAKEAIRALSPARVAEDVPSADEVPHFWMGHRDKEPSTEEMLRVSDALVQAVNEDYWKDAVVQWPQHFLHTKECNVHEPALSLCSCGLETRLKDEILRLQHRLYEVAEEKAVHENDGEKLKVEKYYRDVGALRPASCGCYPEGNPGDCPAPGCSRSGG